MGETEIAKKKRETEGQRKKKRSGRERESKTEELGAYLTLSLGVAGLSVLISSVLLVAVGERDLAGQDSLDSSTPTIPGPPGGWEGCLPQGYTFRDLRSDVGTWQPSQGAHLGPTSGTDQSGPSPGDLQCHQITCKPVEEEGYASDHFGGDRGTFLSLRSLYI